MSVVIDKSNDTLYLGSLFGPITLPHGTYDDLEHLVNVVNASKPCNGEAWFSVDGEYIVVDFQKQGGRRFKLSTGGW